MKSSENWQAFSEKIYDFIHVQSLGASADTHMDEILIVTSKFYRVYLVVLIS